MAWEIGPFFLRAGATAGHAFGWDGEYKGIQALQARPEVWGSGTWLTVVVVGDRVDLAVTNTSVVFYPENGAYGYQVDVTARTGLSFQYKLRGHRVD